jgi:ankyrin repeat protein
VEIEAKDIQERTPFYFAVTEGDLHIIRYLYEKGADINNKSKLGRSALSKSCYLGLIDVVAFLIGCPGIILTSEDGKGRTALHNAVFGPKGGRDGHKFGTN